MPKIIVAGCGTGVGKTLVSAILLTALKGEYWKPIQCGEVSDSDTEVLRALLPLSAKSRIHSPAYNLRAPLSPHQAAHLENVRIDPNLIHPPLTACPLIIESVGGILVPLNEESLTLDLFATWQAVWIVVSQHYLGSINHTLLTIEVLRQRRVDVRAVVFNGAPQAASEEAIGHFSGLPCLGKLLPEEKINYHTIERYAQQWKRQVLSLLH